MKKYYVKCIIIAFIIFMLFCLFVLISNSPKLIAYRNELVRVDSIYHSPPGLGAPHTTVIGQNRYGDEMGIWIQDNYIYNRKMIYKEYLNNGISREEVFDILNEEELNNTSELPIICFISSDGKYMNENSLYWIVPDAQNSFNEEYLIVNFYTGEIVDVRKRN